MTIRGLFPRLAHEHGEENISAFFSPRAVSEGRYMKYDPIKKNVTTEADESIFSLNSIDQDMVANHKKTTTLESNRYLKRKDWKMTQYQHFNLNELPLPKSQQDKPKRQKPTMKAAPRHLPQVYPEQRNIPSIPK